MHPDSVICMNSKRCCSKYARWIDEYHTGVLPYSLLFV